MLTPFSFSGFFPFFLPLLELLGASFFPKASTNFFKTIVEKIRAERNESSHQVWTNHTARGGKLHGCLHGCSNFRFFPCWLKKVFRNTD